MPRSVLYFLVGVALAAALAWVFLALQQQAAPAVIAPAPVGGAHPAPAPPTASANERIDVATGANGVRLARSATGATALCGLATPDFRWRRSVHFGAGEADASVDWPDAVGFPALLWSDRAAPVVVRAAPSGALQLPRHPALRVRVRGAQAPCAIHCQTPVPCAWVYELGSTAADGELVLPSADPTCRYRVVAESGHAVSSWHAAAGGEVELVADQPAIAPMVTTATGRSFVGAIVHALDRAGRIVDSGVTDASGTARLRAVPDAVRWVADAPGQAPTAAATPGTLVLSQGRTVAFRLVRSGVDAVDGTLVWEGPLARRANVVRGVAMLRDVPREAFEVRLLEGGSATSTMVPSAVEHYTWELGAALAVEGRLSGHDAPGWGYAVLLDGAGPRAPVAPPREGFFRFDNVPDTELSVRVVVTSAIAGTETEVGRFPVRPGRYADIRLGPESLPACEVRCTIKGSKGEPFPGLVTVILVRDGASVAARHVAVTSDAACTFSQLLPGRYTGHAQPDAWDFPVVATVMADPLRVGFCDFVLPECSTCTLTLAGLALATDCLLGLRRAGEVDWLARRADQPRGAAGPLAWTWAGIPPGDYELSWFGAGLSPAIRPLRIPPGSDFRAAIEQLPSVRCAIRILGVTWGRGPCALRIATVEGKVLRTLERSGDPASWNVDLDEGTFHFEVQRGREARATTATIRRLGDVTEVLLYCQ